MPPVEKQQYCTPFYHQYSTFVHEFVLVCKQQLTANVSCLIPAQTNWMFLLGLCAIPSLNRQCCLWSVIAAVTPTVFTPPASSYGFSDAVILTYFL